MGIIPYLILPVAIAIVVFWWFRSNANKKYYKNLPEPPKVFLLGHALDVASTSMVLDSFSKYTKEFGGLVKLQLGPFVNSLLVADYKMLEFLLSSTKLLKKSEDYQYFYSWLGEGLLIGSGPKWKKHRKILTPAFHLQILEDFIETFESCGDILVRKLSQEVVNDSVDIYPYVTLCTLDVICETTMGTSINAQENDNLDYVQSVKDMTRILIERATSPLQMNDLLFLFTKNYRTQRRAIRILHEKSNSVISQRMRERQRESDITEGLGKKKKVFLDILLDSEVDGRPLTHQEIREEVDTFMFAGHDTTAAAIGFTLFCIAKHPEVQKQVHDEQINMFGENKNPVVTVSDLQQMKYLELVIKESLRLYPSVPIIGRQTEEDLYYENTCIPKKDTMLLFLYGLHRNPKYFEDPETFNPHRFESSEMKYPYIYLPFSAGPRNCIGQKFAMLEMKSIISKIIRHFKLSMCNPEHKLLLLAETVLKSGNGIKINIEHRS